ncbi:hypothetical protein ACVWZA_002912 [Sphingomonas sp. UYAg733]
MNTAASAVSPAPQSRRTLGAIQLLVAAMGLISMALPYLLAVDTARWTNLLFAAMFCCWATDWLIWPDRSSLPSRVAARAGGVLTLAIAVSLLTQFSHIV